MTKRLVAVGRIRSDSHTVTVKYASSDPAWHGKTDLSELADDYKQSVEDRLAGNPYADRSMA